MIIYREQCAICVTSEKKVPLFHKAEQKWKAEKKAKDEEVEVG